MENKKDIGKLFEKHLANVEATPKKTVWQNIESTLKRKRRIRLGYIWLSSLFVLSLLLLLFYGWSLEKTIPEAPQNRQKITMPDIKNERVADPVRDSAAVVSGLSNTPSSDQDQGQQRDSVQSRLHGNKPLSSGMERKPADSRDISNSQASAENLARDKDNTKGIGTKISGEKGAGEATFLKNYNRDSESKATAHANVKDQKNALEKSKSSKESNKVLRETSLEPDSTLRSLSQNRTEFVFTSGIPKDSTSMLNDSVAKTTKRFPRKKLVKDSTETPKPKLGELNEYRLFPFAKISYYGGLTGGSAIDPRLDDNRKTTTIRAGYGGYFVLRLPSKWSFRLGVTHTAIQKNTLGVPIAPNDSNTNFYRDINFRNNFSYSAFSESFSQEETISLEEKLAFLEFPVEVGYTVWEDEGWGLDALAGLKVSILGKNRLFAINGNGEHIFLGSNDNYSKSHFGLIFGASLFYNVHDAIQLRLEPTLESGLSVFEKNVGNNPVIIHLKIGAIIRF